MSQARHHTGEAHKRFTKVATLLSLIDPVRGEPTPHSLDRHPHDIIGKQESLQKKFLDSFALICSTSKQGGETASAVCLEPGHPSGTVLRLARNIGFPQSLVHSLHAVLDNLTLVATGESSSRMKENEILCQIIGLTWEKICSLLERLRYPDVREAAHNAIEEMGANGDFLEEVEGTQFQVWVKSLLDLTHLTPDPMPYQLIPHIKWASQARWVYSEHLESLLCHGTEELPDWINCVYKLGRYYAAAKNMLKLAVKQPALFTPIHIELVDAPERQYFSLPATERNALRTVLEKLTKTDPENLKAQLGQIWLSDDPELRFRRACRLNLTVHAEMQLLSFYDHHPEHTPRPLFMGTSKKACFLCHRFMSRHPLEISVSASHQKLYPSWMPPPCSDSAVRKQHKVLLWELSRHLEQTTARDLETRLGVRRPKALDSTAGPSLPTTESMASGWWVGRLPIHGRTSP